jgi:hypothetical protein
MANAPKSNIRLSVSLHPAQARVKAEAKRFNVLACGRRWGKSAFAQALMAETAGEGYPVGYFCPTYKHLKQQWREFSSRLKRLTEKKSEAEYRLEFFGGGVAEFWSLDSENPGRSRKYKRVIVDEAGLPADLEVQWMECVRPTLADLRGDAWFMGTPKGRNFFWTAYCWGDGDKREWKSWRMPTAENPIISAEEIESMREEMTDRAFRQEVLAEFLSDGGGVFRGVRECATAEVQEFPVDGHSYVIGVDWGRKDNFTVYTVFDMTSMAAVYFDRMRIANYDQQKGRLISLWDRFGHPVIIAEENAMGGPVIEDLRMKGLPVHAFRTTAITKPPLIDALALAIERQDISYPDDPILIKELEAYESEQLPSGGTRYSAPRGMTDDHVISLALANWAGGRRRHLAFVA